MDLNTAVWPCVSNIIRVDSVSPGFGGTLLPTGTEYQTYSNNSEVETEIKKTVKIEEPLPPEKEADQRERISPEEASLKPEEEEPLKTTKAVAKRVRQVEDHTPVGPPVKKKKKKTLF